jgi:DNA polymerase III alpha subunit
MLNSTKMKTDQYGQIVLDRDDVFDLIMQGRDLAEMRRIVVDDTVDIENMVHQVENVPDLVVHTFVDGSDQSVPEYDEYAQRNWHMPEEYKRLDIAQYILNICQTDAELQRVGEELLLYQERNMFDLLRYLKYLVDTMRENHVIWGVGRGSSVASYVLFLLGVHRINSMYYDLDPQEFLR